MMATIKCSMGRFGVSVPPCCCTLIFFFRCCLTNDMLAATSLSLNSLSKARFGILPVVASTYSFQPRTLVWPQPGQHFFHMFMHCVNACKEAVWPSPESRLQTACLQLARLSTLPSWTCPDQKAKVKNKGARGIRASKLIIIRLMQLKPPN